MIVIQSTGTYKKDPTTKKGVLKMATYFKGSNNGVTAVVTAEVYQKMEERCQLLAECEKKGLPRPQLPPITPVFTFSSATHGAFKFMTGSYEVLIKLLEGHDVQTGSIWVPFSNGIQWGHDEAARWELEFMTTLDEAIEAFGIKIGN
jgi:hypothetical protein